MAALSQEAAVMLYSVWNQGARRYDYYETAVANGSANAEPPTHLRPGKLGATMTTAAWPLPAGAMLIGSGALPRGRIAAQRHGGEAMGNVESSSPILWLAMGIGAAALLRGML